ncbi:hypothetical protein [Devosia sp.]|uniref:hypothetical protein n=1 Tax=Devosia sp. TaxID=1871048 RepID=UPI003F6EC650
MRGKVAPGTPGQPGAGEDPYVRKGDEKRIAAMMRELGAHSDAASRSLRFALRATRGALGATAKRKEWSKRNDDLEAVARAALALSSAYSKLDGATRAALFEASWRGELPSQLDMSADEADPPYLSQLLGAARVNPSILRALEEHALEAKSKTEGGRPINEAFDDTVRMLATIFELHHASRKPPSRKDGGPFHRFVMRAFTEAGYVVPVKARDELNAEKGFMINTVRRVLRARGR